MKETLIAIKEAIDHLNSLSDQVNVIFHIINQLFSEWSVSVEAEYSLSNGDIFHYGKLNGKYRFYIEYMDDKKIPIEKASRRTRLELISRLPHLLELILIRIQNQCQEIPKAQISNTLNEIERYYSR